MMTKQAADKCQGHAHPIPTTDEQDQMSVALVEAAQALDKAWGYANRTPAYHDLTERIAGVMADLTTVQRTL